MGKYIHSRVNSDEANGSIGFEKIASLVKVAKAENPNMLLVAANVIKADGTTLLPPYVIKEIDGIKKEHDKNLGYVDLYIEDGTVTSKKARLVKYEDTLEVKADEEVEALFASVKEVNDKITSIVVGSTPVKLDGERESIRVKQTNLGSVIADAMIYETGADVAIINGGGLRASLC